MGEAWNVARRRTRLDATGSRCAPRTGAASSIWPRCGSRRRRRQARPAGRRAPVVHDDVRAGQHPHQPSGAAVRTGARKDHAAGAGRLQGPATTTSGTRIPAASRTRCATASDRVRGPPALAVLRHGRRDAALRGPARRVRALDRRHKLVRRSSSRLGGAALDRRVRRPRRATATSSTSGATKRPVWRTSAGRTPGTRSRTGTGGCPASRGRPVSSRATRTTRRCEARVWPVRSGATPLGRRARAEAAELKRPLQPRLLGRGRGVFRARAGRRSARSTPCRRTSATCCGAASSTRQGEGGRCGT